MKLSQLTAPCKVEYVKDNKRYLLEVNKDNYPSAPEFNAAFYFIGTLFQYNNVDATTMHDELTSLLDSLGVEYEPDSDERELMQLAANVDSVVFYALSLNDKGDIVANPFADELQGEFRGFAYHTKCAFETNYYVCDDWRKCATDIILADIDRFNHYMRGDVYMYKLSRYDTTWNEVTCPHCGEIIKYNVHEEPNVVDICFNFYGAYLASNGMLEYFTDVEVTEVE